jgi:hypothetical protein
MRRNQIHKKFILSIQLQLANCLICPPSLLLHPHGKTVTGPGSLQRTSITPDIFSPAQRISVRVHLSPNPALLTCLESFAFSPKVPYNLRYQGPTPLSAYYQACVRKPFAKLRPMLSRHLAAALPNIPLPPFCLLIADIRIRQNRFFSPPTFVCPPPPSPPPFLLKSTKPHFLPLAFPNFLLGNPASLLASRSPSASHLLALTNCTTLIICFPAMTGALTPAMTHGQNESILFARASSSAPADHGLAKSVCGATCDGLPGWREPGTGVPAGVLVWRREGERRGEEKERR